MAEKPDFTPFQVLLHLEDVVMAWIYLIFDRFIAHQYNKASHICKTYIQYIWTVVITRLLLAFRGYGLLHSFKASFTMSSLNNYVQRCSPVKRTFSFLSFFSPPVMMSSPRAPGFQRWHLYLECEPGDLVRASTQQITLHQMGMPVTLGI